MRRPDTWVAIEEMIAAIIGIFLMGLVYAIPVLILIWVRGELS